MRRVLRRAGLPAALLLLMGVASVSYMRIRQFRTDLFWRAHTHIVLEHIERTQTSLLAADSLRRAYRLSRDKADLVQMEARLVNGARELDMVEELTRDNPLQTRRIAALRPFIREREGILHDGIELPSWELLDAKTRDEQRTHQIRGSELAKLVGVQIDAMRSEEERLLTERARQAIVSADSTENTILYGSPIGMGLVALFYVSLVLENRGRLRAQAELAQSNAVIHGVLDGAYDIIGVKDLQGRYVLINPAGLLAFGRDRTDILGKTVGELLSNDTGRSIMEMDERLMRAGETAIVEQTTTVGDLRRTYLTTKAPYRDTDGAVIGIISISREITERKRLEEQLAQQNRERGEIIEKLKLQSQELTRVGEMLRVQAVRDGLTGLFNRRYMDETLTRELARAARKSHPLSVMMIDLDHFKALNDMLGHAAGDDVLKRFGELLLNGVRRDDVACRYGGEEFAVILPDMRLEGAIERAEKLRVAAKRLAITVDGRVRVEVSASFGVACFPMHGDTGEALLLRADAALYEAKSRGRNRVVAAVGAVGQDGGRLAQRGPGC